MHPNTKIWLPLGLAIGAQAPQLHAQGIGTGQEYMLDMSAMLWYIFPFYALMLMGLALFIQKVIRPKQRTYWLYVCVGLGIVWSVFITRAFKQIETEQLPSGKPSAAETVDLSPEAQAQLRQLDKEAQGRWYANFWVVATPNVVLALLGLVVDWRNRKPETR